MTKEELEKEAKEWCKKKNLTPSNVGYFTADYCEQAYLAGAEPREKRIEELEEKIKSLEGNSSLHEGILWNDIHNQDKKIAELEAQIEKMRCCANCQTVRDAEGNCYLEKDGKCKNKDKWELRR